MADHAAQKITSDGAANAVLAWVAATAAVAVALLFMGSELDTNGPVHPVLYFPAFIAGLMLLLALVTTRSYLRSGKAVLHIDNTARMDETWEATLALPGAVKTGDMLQITLKHLATRGHDPKTLSTRTVWSATNQIQTTRGPNGPEARIAFKMPATISIEHPESTNLSWGLEVRLAGQPGVRYSFRNIAIRAPRL